MIAWRRKFDLAHAFALAAVVFGMAIALLTPPFQVADEPGHFLRAYQISEGQLRGVWRDGFGGGDMPISLLGIGAPFGNLWFHPHGKTSRQIILQALHRRIKPNHHQYLEFPGALYCPIVYAPQATGIALARWAGTGALALMYAGRLAMVLAYAGIGYFSLRMTPILQRGFFLLLMMPMALSLGASLSADAMTISLAAAATATALRAAVDPQWKITPLRGAALAAWFTAVALCKFVYFPVLVVILLIPTARFVSPGRRWAWIGAILLIAGGAALFWAHTTPGIHGRVVRRDDVAPMAQLHFIANHPLHFLDVLWLTTLADAGFMTLSFVGWLGWLDTHLASHVLEAYAIALLVMCIPEAEQPARWKLSWPQIAMLLLAAALSTAMLATLQYLFWTPVHGLLVDGMQGRYLIPLAPLVLVAAYGIWANSPLRLGEAKNVKWLNWASAGIAVLMSIYTLLVIYRRYYI